MCVSVFLQVPVCLCVTVPLGPSLCVCFTFPLCSFPVYVCVGACVTQLWRDHNLTPPPLCPPFPPPGGETSQLWESQRPRDQGDHWGVYLQPVGGEVRVEQKMCLSETFNTSSQKSALKRPLRRDVSSAPLLTTGWQNCTDKNTLSPKPHDRVQLGQ